MDATRFDQFGVWSGRIRSPDGDVDVGLRECLGTKDRSWGTRPVGAPQALGAPQAPQGMFFLRAPLFWDDHVSQAIFFDGEKGEALFCEGLTAPLHAIDAELPESANSEVEKLTSVAHHIDYHAGTRLAKHAELALRDLAGATRKISLEPMLRFHMKGLGYGHPTWRHGLWHDELATGHDAFDPNQLDLLAIDNLHVQQVVRARDGDGEGVGLLEQVVLGPYAPAGFASFLMGRVECGQSGQFVAPTFTVNERNLSRRSV